MNAIVAALNPALNSGASAADQHEGRAWTPVLRGVRLGTPRSLDQEFLKQLLADAQATIAEQQERIAHLESLTMTDELTGLLNRRGFYDHFRRELAAARRIGAPGGTGGGVVVMIDLDGFKGINDTHGHLTGDSYLRQVARLIAAAVRREDVVARIGGDEFAILLTGMDANAGAARAQQLLDMAEGWHLHWNGAELPIRFSLGVQAYGAGDQEDEVMRKADAHMYGNKGHRRHRRAERASA
ncbi:GGDEF domain-containing protein [Azospirillum rugosum]|uniref:diguanylate cyclase n=1 Tax=Azospirillum rugosum TaxID=416170 RepID=A0ABS4SE80_9PROT|nr:GGDEF domain-containing protein [Azospirillum rugosum]MBP2290878.1 diguanylate cyclase (GGDEF)-like protein [Azospirillum rugosum]MDQ0529745.1 diguanylate cyclase (GGDEF)-like protein [Azospirillum rugosum]